MSDTEVMQEIARPGSNGRRKQTAEPLPSLRAILESILFATDRPVTLKELEEAIPEAERELLEATLAEMERGYAEREAGFRLERIANGYQLLSAPSLHAYVERFLVGRKRSRLSRAALETLAAVAYRQPITRGELEEIRGVDCGQVLHTLLARSLVTVRGRSQALGRPLVYGTTSEFLSYFGLSSLADLPSLEEFESLHADDPLQDPEIREALETRGLLEESESIAEPGESETPRPEGRGAIDAPAVPENGTATFVTHADPSVLNPFEGSSLPILPGRGAPPTPSR